MNAQEVTISYRLFSNVEAFGDYGKKLEQGLMREANAGDDRRERRRRGENVPFSNPNVEHLTIKAMATGTDDWWEKNGLLQLESLGLIFRQLDLPNVRFLKYRQEDMWGFHCTQFPWFWDRIADAFQGADYPLLEELELELEMDQDAWICDTVLCVSELPHIVLWDLIVIFFLRRLLKPCCVLSTLAESCVVSVCHYRTIQHSNWRQAVRGSRTSNGIATEQD